MSELCACGSGLKLKDCCISEDIAAIKKFTIKDIIWPERLEWAIAYIEYKTVHNTHIVTGQNDYAESIGKKITCEKKCSLCCLEFIAARIEECDAIATYLYFNPGLMHKFLLNYQAWHDAITSESNILNKVSNAYKNAFETLTDEDKKLFESFALEYAKKYAPCPFLEDDLCMIYPIRPYTCSTYAVLSDKKYCAPNLPEEAYIEHKLKVKSEKNPLYFETEYFDTDYYIDLKHRYILGSMQRMVYNMLKYGPSRLEAVLQS